MKAELILKKIKTNWFAKCVCIAAAILIYIFGKAARLQKRVFSVPLIVKEEGNLVSSQIFPPQVSVIVIAENKNILNIASNDIEASIDLSFYTKPGQYRVPILACLSSNVVLEEPVQLVVTPEYFTINLEELTRKSVPIIVNTDDKILHGYDVEIKPNPATAVIVGPKSMVENIHKVETEEIQLAEKKDNFTATKNFVNVNRHIQLVSPQLVEVEVNFKASTVSKTFNNCQIFFGNLSPQFKIEEKPEISFTVSGAQLVLEKYYPSEYTVQADCTNITSIGEYELPIVIALQDAINIESQSLQTVKIIVSENVITDDGSVDNKNIENKFSDNKVIDENKSENRSTDNKVEYDAAQTLSEEKLPVVNNNGGEF